jgi:hypothetical protein
MKPKKRRHIYLSIYCSHDLKKEVETVAATERRSISAQTITLIEEALKARYKREEKSA